MSMITHSILFGVLIPLATGAVILGIPFFLRRDIRSSVHATDQLVPSASTESVRWSWWGGLALAMGYLAGYVGLLGVPKWSDVGATLWLVWLLPGTILFAVSDSLKLVSQVWQWLARAIFLGLFFWLMFRGQVNNGVWTPTKLYLMLGLMTGLGLVFWLSWTSIAAQLSETSTAWAMLVFSIFTSLLLVLSGSAKFGQLFGAAVSVIGVWWIFSLWSQRRSIAVSWTHGILPVFVFLIFGFTLNGYFYADVRAWTGSMLLLAPISLAVIPRIFAPQKPWFRLAFLTLLVSLPLLIAVGILAYQEMTKPKDTPYYYSR